MMTRWLATEIAVHCAMLEKYPEHTPHVTMVALLYRHGAMRSRRFGRGHRRVRLRGGV